MTCTQINSIRWGSYRFDFWAIFMQCSIQLIQEILLFFSLFSYIFWFDCNLFNGTQFGGSPEKRTTHRFTACRIRAYEMARSKLIAYVKWKFHNLSIPYMSISLWRRARSINSYAGVHSCVSYGCVLLDAAACIKLININRICSENLFSFSYWIILMMTRTHTHTQSTCFPNEAIVEWALCRCCRFLVLSCVLEKIAQDVRIRKLCFRYRFAFACRYTAMQRHTTNRCDSIGVNEFMVQLEIRSRPCIPQMPVHCGART